MTSISGKYDQSFLLTEKVLARLEARENLRDLAGVYAIAYSRGDDMHYLTEGDGATACFTPAANGYQDTKMFSCDDTFTCYKVGQSFMCNGGNTYAGSCEQSNIYNGCGGAANFECNIIHRPTIPTVNSRTK